MNRSILVVLSGALLTACGAALPPATTCTVESLGTIRADYNYDCQVLASNVALVREILDSRGIVPDDEFEETFRGVPLVLHNTDELWKVTDDEFVGGFYGPNGVELTRATTYMLHEFLHHVDGLFTVFHPNWEARGFNAAQEEYQGRYKTPVVHSHSHAASDAP